MPLPILEIDNSRRSTFSACPRKYFYRYIKNIVPEIGSTALRGGSTWHGLLEGYYSSVIKNGWSADNVSAALTLGKKVWDEESEGFEFYEDYRTFDAFVESFFQYLEEFQSDKMHKEIISAERIFKLQMWLTTKERDLFQELNNFDLYFTGKLDLEVELSGQRWIEEFKSTGQPISVQASRLHRATQVIGYVYAARALGLDIAGALISIHQLLSRKKVDGTYGKYTRKYLRQPHVFSSGDMSTWRENFLYNCNKMAEAHELNFFPCELDSCYQFGRCAYSSLCEQNRPYNELNLTGYVEKVWNVLTSGSSQDTVNLIEG